ncbi:MAG TPA: hypothetical protein VJN18_20945 [Polyangiaceae bacterium]|nr:hypothetical protein [Polyangiaceae bacterium]
MAAQFSLSTGDGPREAVRLFLLAREFDDDPALPDIVAQLSENTWRAHYTATFELEVAAAMKRRNFGVAVVARQRGGDPTPDLRVQLAQRWIDIECTALVQSQKEGTAEDVVETLFLYPSRDKSLQRSVHLRFCAGADADDALEAMSELEKGIVLAASENRWVDVAGLANIEPFGEPVAYPAVMVHGALAVGTWDQPFVQLGRSLRKKLTGGQLSPQKPSVIFIRTRSFSLQMSRDPEAWLREIACTVENEIQQAGATVSAVFVYERWRGHPEQPLHVREPGLAILSGAEVRGTHRLAVLVHNAAASHPLSVEETEQLLSLQFG